MTDAESNSRRHSSADAARRDSLPRIRARSRPAGARIRLSSRRTDRPGRRWSVPRPRRHTAASPPTRCCWRRACDLAGSPTRPPWRAGSACPAGMETATFEPGRRTSAAADHHEPAAARVLAGGPTACCRRGRTRRETLREQSNSAAGARRRRGVGAALHDRCRARGALAGRADRPGRAAAFCASSRPARPGRCAIWQAAGGGARRRADHRRLCRAPDATLAALTGLIALPFLCVTVLRVVALREVTGLLAAGDGRSASDAPRIPDRLLPVYTVLVPLLREANVLPDLVAVAARARLSRPPSSRSSWSSRPPTPRRRRPAGPAAARQLPHHRRARRAAAAPSRRR